MLDALMDVAKLGVGAIWLSKENLKKITDNLAEIGKISKEEGERLFKEMETSGEEQRKKLADLVDDTVKKTLDKAGLATKTEVEELRRKVLELETMMGAGGS